MHILQLQQLPDQELWPIRIPNWLLIYHLYLFCKWKINYRAQQTNIRWENFKIKNSWIWGLTYASVMFSHVEQITTATTLVAAPCILAFTVRTLARCLLFAFINIWNIHRCHNINSGISFLMKTRSITGILNVLLFQWRTKTGNEKYLHNC